MAWLLRDVDVRRVLTMPEALRAVEDAFAAVARGEALNIPRQRGTLANATLNTMGAIVPALDLAGIKCYPVVRQDTTVGSSLTMLVYRISTGKLIGVMDANSLSQIRTGAASGVATKYMARQDSRVMTLFGSGWQAQTQLEAIALVLPGLERVHVIGRSTKRALQFCEEMGRRVDLDLGVPPNVEAAVRESDVITTITGAHDPVFDGRWLPAGVHINAAGSNYANKREIDAVCVRRAHRIVVDDLELARLESGDLIGAGVQDLDWRRVRALADVVCGNAPGRASSEEVTLFESQGLGLEDVAVAGRALDLAREQGIGTDAPIS